MADTTLDGKAEEIIRLNNVRFRYPGGAAPSLDGIDLILYKGDFVAVAGSNGSGKSTMCKTFNGLIPNYYAGDLEGEITINGKPAAGQSVSELSRQVAYVFQDFENQLVRPNVLEEACFPPLNFGFADYRERGAKALRLLGLEHLEKEWIWQLSGGQKHMVALASALSLDPEVIVIDEPVAQLDPARARMIYDSLKMLNEKWGKTIVVIEHHTEFIADYCRKLVLMDSGRVIWVKPVQEGLSDVEQLLQANIQPPQVTQAVHALEKTASGAVSAATEQANRAGSPQETPGLYPVTLEQAAQRLSLAARGPESSEALAPACCAIATAAAASGSGSGGTKWSAAEHNNPPIVRLSGVVSGYRDLNRAMKPVLNGISLSFAPGERVAVVGNNGAGKSTLLRLISGIRRPWQGEVTVCGLNTRKASPERLANHVAFLFQNPEEMFIQDDIRKDVEYYLQARKLPSYHDFIEDIICRFRLKDIEKRDGRLLSGGQQRRATLAIGLAMRPAVMLLDEPTASLDIASRREMTLLLEQLKDKVQVVLVATHDMQLVADWASRVIVMHEGRVLLDGDSRTLFQRPDIMEKAHLVPPQIVQLSQRLGMAPAALSVREFTARYQIAGGERIAYGSC